MKIAFVYDRVNKFGGAERVLLALHEIWPEAPLYTGVYNKFKASWSDIFQINSSFLKSLPFSSSFHEMLPLVTPYAFESFNFDEYDIVLSVTSNDAKGILTKPNTCHVCYCLTPTRYLWSAADEYLKEPGVGFLNPVFKLFMKTFFVSLRRWDYISSRRPDKYISISESVQERIKKYYGLASDIIYPPIDTENFNIKNVIINKNKYYLIVSRLVPYKKIDYVISTFNKSGIPLKIIGSGIDEKRLKITINNNVEFIPGDLTDQKLCWYYQNCKALIFPGEEDFGITSVEAQSCGRPVIGYAFGGVRETIIEGKTGEIYFSQTEESLSSAISKFEKRKYSSLLCRENALKYDKKNFKNKMKKEILKYWALWKMTGTIN